MSDSDQIDNESSNEAAPPGRFRKLIGVAATWAGENPLQGAIVVGLSVLVMLALVAIWPKSISTSDSDKDVSMASALESLDEGAYTHAQEVATKLRDGETLLPEEFGGPLFVLGAVMYHDAENVASNDQKRYYRLAAEHLEEARDRGFPDGRRAQGLYLLGKSLFMSGQLASSRTVLREAQQVAEDRHRPELHKLLALANLRDLEAPKKNALTEIEAFLTEDELPPEELHEGLLIKSQIQFALEDLAGAKATLGQVPSSNSNSSQITLLQARMLIEQARKLPSDEANQTKRKELYAAAIDTFRKAQGQDRLGSLVTQQAMYLIGIALNESGQPREALDQFVKTRKQHFDAPVGLVASLHEANLLREHDDDAAVEAYRRTLAMAGHAEGFKNTWTTLRELRKHIHKAYQAYVDSGKFQQAFDIAERSHPVFSRVEKMHLTAGARRLWAKSLLKSAEGMHGQKARTVEQEARAQLRKAGRIYSHLAKLRIATRHYPEDIWNGATSFLEGQDYKNAVKLLRIYRENEQRAHSAEALVGLGESLLALSQIDESIEAIQQCVNEYPRHAATFRARLLGSKAYTEKGEPEKAEKLLLENLNSELTPASQEWRDSLFALGMLLYTSGKYEEAVTRLEEAVARYPDTRQSLEARYLMAEAYREAAKEPEKLLESDTIQTARVAHMRQMQQLLAGALNQYDAIRKILNRRQETSKLTRLESAILRNCYFAQGAALYNLRRYEEAIEAYSTATNRYQNDPEVLAAFLQISDCYRRLGKRIAARGNIERAKLVLSRFPPDVDFAKTTNFTREQWEDLLEQYSKL